MTSEYEKMLEDARAAAEATWARLTAATEYHVEADEFATGELWLTWCYHGGLPWEAQSPGMWTEIGKFHGEPVCVSVSWIKVDAYTIALWNPTSRVVSYDLVEAWLRETFPNVKRRSNALNFHNIVLDIGHRRGSRFQLDMDRLRKR